jgi:DNA-binding beta-propeller fold protein YncE
MRSTLPRPFRLAFLGALATMGLLGLASATAGAADQVLWASFVSDKISRANLDGSGGVQSVNTAGATANEPFGLAIDPVGGRVYWANHTGGKISWANLDGSGGGDVDTGTATVSAPSGVAVDVAARRLYWINNGVDKVSWANLDGPGAGDLSIGGAPIETPLGITVFPAAGRLYWTNYGFLTGFISYANTDGSGGGTLPITGVEMDTPAGVAVDAATGRLYWPSANKGVIYFTGLNGGPGAELDDRGLEIKGPYGIALDPEAGRAYLANTVGDSIMFVRLDGTGGASLPFEVDPGSGAGFATLLLDPRPRGAPGASGSLVVPQTARRKGGASSSKALRPTPTPPRVAAVDLTCTPGAWAGDLAEAFLYRAPLSTSIQWTRDGGEVPGATTATYRATEVGNYRCRETATNRAGSASQLSPVVAFFKVGGVQRNRRKGTARLAVELPPNGSLAVAGRGIVARQVLLPGKRKVRIKPKGRKKARLKATGKVSLKVRLTFTPTDGPPVSQTAPVMLKKKISR